MRARIFAALVALVSLAVSFSAPAKAAKLCGWMVESEEENDVRKLTIFLAYDGACAMDANGRSVTPRLRG